MRIIDNMNLRQLDLNLLTVFDALQTERNLTRAAKRVGLSQPAMSNALSRLRLAVGDPLFKRTSQGMVPTPRALQLAEPIRQALDLIQNGLRSPHEFDLGSSRRTFVIAAEDYGEVVILPRLLDWLGRMAPGVSVRIRSEPGLRLQGELLDGSVDMAFDFFRMRAKGFTSQQVLEDTLVTMARTDHPVAGEHINLTDYVSIPHIALTPRTSTVPVVDRALERLQLARTIVAHVPHFISMPLIVQKSNLLCTLPRRMADVFADNFRLRVLRTPVELPAVPVYLFWHNGLDKDPGHRWLRSAIIELCRRL